MSKSPIEQNLEKIDKAVVKKDQRRLKALMQNLTREIKNESAVGISGEVRSQIKSLVSSLELEAIVHFPTIVADLENIKNELGEAHEVKTEVSATNIQNETAPHMAVKVEWETDLLQKMEADPTFNVMYFNNEKGGLEGVMRKLNGLGCRIKSTVDLVMMVKTSVLEALGKIIQEEDVLSLSSVIPAIKNEEEYLQFRKRLKDEFRKTMQKPVATPVTPAEITKVSPEESVAKTGEPSVKLVRASLPIVTQNPTIAPEIPKISEKEKVELMAKKEEVKVKKETKNLEKLALKNAPKEFREWTLLFNALHHRNLPEDAEKAAKAKKNRESVLGTPDEKTFLQLRNVLERGALKNFINARDRIKAMEAISGVENLDEKSIKKNLADVIGGIKSKIEEAKQKLAKAPENKREAPAKTEIKVGADTKAPDRPNPPEIEMQEVSLEKVPDSFYQALNRSLSKEDLNVMREAYQWLDPALKKIQSRSVAEGRAEIEKLFVEWMKASKGKKTAETLKPFMEKLKRTLEKLNH